MESNLKIKILEDNSKYKDRVFSGYVPKELLRK